MKSVSSGKTRGSHPHHHRKKKKEKKKKKKKYVKFPKRLEKQKWLHWRLIECPYKKDIYFF